MPSAEYSLCFMMHTPCLRALDKGNVLVREMYMDSRSDRLDIKYGKGSISGEMFLDTRELGPRFPPYERLYHIPEEELQKFASSEVFGFDEEEQKEFLAELIRLRSLEDSLIKDGKVVFPNVTNSNLPATKL